MASKVAKRRGRLREDRISQMPYDILVRILSLLDDTSLAVRTTVLSKRWNNLWVSISTIRCRVSEQCDYRLMTFVDRVESLHGSSDIRIFKFLYDIRDWERETTLADDYARIHRCISTVVEHNVVELDLTIFNQFDAEPEIPSLLPQSLFMCKTLVVLKLGFSNSMSFSNCPTEECFPSLKVLDMRAFVVDPDPPMFIQNLFTCCPVLEDLTIDGMLENYRINISAPELKILRISLIDSSAIFSINAPKLEKVVLSDNSFRPNNYLFENGKSLINVELRLETDVNDASFGGVADPTSLFAKISKVEYLSLSLRGVSVSYLPEFVNLSRLVLVLHDFNNWEFLIECLNRSPNLKHLVLEKKWLYKQDELEWNSFNPLELPGCLVSHLQTISVKEFEGRRDEMEMTEFLLKNGHGLNTVSIQIVDKGLLYTKEELYKKLLTYKRGSGSCVIFAD